MPPSIATCYRTCSPVWTRPIRRSSGVSSGVRRGEKAGFPRFKGRDRWHSLTFHSFTFHSFTFHSFTFHSFTCKEYGNGAALDNGLLVLSKIGRLRVQLGASVSNWSRPIAGTPKRSRSAQKPMAGTSACRARRFQHGHYPQRDKKQA